MSGRCKAHPEAEGKGTKNSTRRYPKDGGGKMSCMHGGRKGIAGQVENPKLAKKEKAHKLHWFWEGGKGRPAKKKCAPSSGFFLCKAPQAATPTNRRQTLTKEPKSGEDLGKRHSGSKTLVAQEGFATRSQCKKKNKTKATCLPERECLGRSNHTGSFLQEACIETNDTLAATSLAKERQRKRTSNSCGQESVAKQREGRTGGWM